MTNLLVNAARYGMPFIPTLLKLELMLYYYAFPCIFSIHIEARYDILVSVSTFWMDMDQCFS
jgi:hypothetical protein